MIEEGDVVVLQSGDKSTVEKIDKVVHNEYMGRTPGKKSKTGRNVIERMRNEGKVRGKGKDIKFKASNGEWYPLKEADMSHRTDAVTWWNKKGRFSGAKSKRVRNFMLSPYNYELDHYSINRSSGARLKQKYLSPVN